MLWCKNPKENSTQGTYLGQIQPLPVFVNKVLLGNRHGHQLHIVYVYLSALIAELNSYNKARTDHKA